MVEGLLYSTFLGGLRGQAEKTAKIPHLTHKSDFFVIQKEEFPMKTISKRFLKGGLAVLLAVIMLFSSCITGFAAVVDNADTKANVDVAETSATITSDGTARLYFNMSAVSWWVASSGNGNFAYFFNSSSNKWSAHSVKYSGNDYYVVIPAGSWTTVILTRNNTSTSPSWDNKWNQTGDITLSSSSNYISKFSEGSTSATWGTAKKPASTASVTPSATSVSVGDTVTLSSALTSNADINTIKSTTYSTTSGATISGNTFTATEPGTYTVTATVTYHPNGYSSLTSTATATTTITVTQPKFGYTVTAGEGGTASPASGEVNEGSSVEITATPSTGYDFAGWEVTNGTVADPSAASTTFTPSANGAIANATFTKKTYTVRFLNKDGGVIGTPQTVAYGDTPVAPSAPSVPGYTFTGWSPAVGAVTGNTDYTAQYSINQYTLTVNQTGGTVKLDGVTTTSKTVNYGTQVAVTITAPTNYNVSNISGGTFTGVGTGTVTGTVTVTQDMSIDVQYASAGSCAPSFAQGSLSLNLGATATNTASTNQYCDDAPNSTFTYTSNNTSVATVGRTTGTVTAKGVGTATITATCSCGETATYTVTVKAPVVSIADKTIAVNETYTPLPTIGNQPASGLTLSYSTVVDFINVSADGIVTGLKPGTVGTVDVVATYNGVEVATTSFNVTVNTPVYSLLPRSQDLIVGQTSTDEYAFVTDSTPAAQSVTITGDAYASVAGNKATALAAGMATITATFKYNDSYSAIATATVNVSAPVIEADKNSVALEYHDDSQYDGDYTATTTVSLNTNAELGNGTGDDITLTYDESVIDVVNNAGVLTITSKKAGATNIVATFHGEEVTIPVTVTTYDPWEYIYVTDTQGWSKMNIYFWDGNATATHDTMIYIGRNESNQRVFAYRFDKTKLPDNIIFKQGAGANDWTNQSVDISYKNATTNAWWINSNSNGKWTVGTWNCPIERPTVSVNNVTVAAGGTADVTATSDGASHTWSTAQSTIATVTGTTATATVAGVAAGDTELSVRAFIAVPQGWKSIASDQSTAYPYISSEAKATVTVTNVLYDVNVKAEFSTDGTAYSEGTTGGTVSYTVDGAEVDMPASLSHGTSFTMTATPADGYAFVDWYLEGSDTPLQHQNPVNGKVVASNTYVAKFVKTYNVQVVLPEGFTSVTYGTVTNTETLNTTANAGTTFTVSAETSDDFIQTGWQVAYADGTTDTVTDLTFTVDSLQSDVVLTPTCAAAHTAHAEIYTNKKATGAFGGNTVTINGEASPAKGQEGDTLEYEAHPGASFTFLGWYTGTEFTDDQCVSKNATYTTTMPADGVTVYALFARNLYLVSGEDKVAFTYNVATDTYTLSSAFVETFTVADDEANVNFDVVNVTDGTYTGATVAGDYTAYTFTADTVNYDTTKNVTYVMTPDGDGSYTLNATLVAKPRFKVSFNGEGVGDYAVGAPVEIEAAPKAGYYLAGASSDPAVNGLTFDSETGLITFDMPENDVDVKATYAQLAQINFNETVGLVFTGTNSNGYYVPGNEYVITVAPQSDKVTILGMTANGGTVTNDAAGTYTLTVTPTDGQIIDVTLTVDAKFTMDYGKKSIGDFGTGSTEDDYGTVTMTKADGTEITNADLVEKTDTITYTATAGDNYIFDGWYSESTCSILNIITRETTYEVTPTADTKIYALFVRKQYIDLDSNYSNTSDQHEMTYEPKTRSFSYTTPDTFSRSAWFSITNNKSGWVDDNSYGRWSGDEFAVTFNSTSYNAYVGWGSECFELQHSADESDEADSGRTPGNPPFQIIVKINENNAIDVSARAKKTNITAYLSYGRNDIVTATSTVTDKTGVTVSNEKQAYNGTDSTTPIKEKYVTVTSSSDFALSFQTQLTATDAADYYIDKFVVYHLDSKTFSIVEPNPLGNNTYSGSVYVDSDVYIVPIFFHTTEYAEANDLVEIDVYFDATALDVNTWGPFVAAYTYGASTTEFDDKGKAIEDHYCGGWPGQLMIPTEDGSSFYTMITVPAADAENPDSIPQGILFSNYMQASVVTNNAGAFGVYNQQQQTYDYREAITLYNNGVEVITFNAKNSTDGYHGDEPSTNNYNITNTVDENADIKNYTFEYLYNRDGVTPMDFYADDVTAPKKVSAADYYVITRGDYPYGKYGPNDEYTSSYSYEADENFKGEWCVEWYIFDKDGNFVTHVLSDALFNDADGDGVPLMVEKIAQQQGISTAEVAGKTVAISYEAPNNDKDNTHQISYDGQWYGNMLSDFVHGNVIVGLEDENGKFNLDTDEEDHIADYGQGYLVDENGDKWGDLNITMDHGEADLSATPSSGYYFVGWYTYVRGEYVRISPSPEYNAYINMNTTYYAIFKAIGPGEVVINHLLYNNPDDPYIPSHGGAANMLVEVYNNTTGDLIKKGVISNSVSTAVFEGEAGIDYRIDITTTPLMGGSFYAWYTDSEDENGNATYEEILTTEEVVGSETTVKSSFYYEYTETSQRLINIYSDIKRVSSYADIVYKYYNRNGEVRTYTVKDVPLTDEECDGYAGTTLNNVTYQYCPTFVTMYEYVHTTSGDVKYSQVEDNAELKAQGYLPNDTYNRIQELAPRAAVTEAIDEVVSWTVEEVNLEIDKSYVVVWADQKDIEFTITAITPDGKEIAKKSGPYNTLAEGIEAPKTFEGKEFSYWIDAETGEILSYLIEYNYRIVEDKTIMAIYGEDVEKWTPVIDSVTYTREYQDTSDYVYSDFLITFNSSEDQELDVMKANGEDVKYGLIMVRDKNYKYEGTNTTLDPVVYPDKAAIDAEIKNVATQMATNGDNVGFNVTVDGVATRYLAYHYDLTSYESTNFNRMEYYLRYNNYVLNNRKYAFKAYVYLVADGVTYVSEPVDVNIYDAATAPVEQ